MNWKRRIVIIFSFRARSFKKNRKIKTYRIIDIIVCLIILTCPTNTTTKHKTIFPFMFGRIWNLLYNVRLTVDEFVYWSPEIKRVDFYRRSLLSAHLCRANYNYVRWYTFSCTWTLIKFVWLFNRHCSKNKNKTYCVNDEVNIFKG